jgi:hypothetical protein
MKIPEFKRSGIGLIAEFRGIPNRFPNQAGRQLPYDCCIYLENGGHLRPTPPPSLYFLMWIKISSQTREPAVTCTNPVPGACNGPMGRCGAKIWGRRCPTHGERGQSRWGVGWRLILLVVVLFCVVLCCVVCCVVCGERFLIFSYRSGRKSTLAKAKWPTFVQSYHKICTQRPQVF